MHLAKAALLCHAIRSCLKIARSHSLYVTTSRLVQAAGYPTTRAIQKPDACQLLNASEARAHLDVEPAATQMKALSALRTLQLQQEPMGGAGHDEGHQSVSRGRGVKSVSFTRNSLRFKMHCHCQVLSSVQAYHPVTSPPPSKWGPWRACSLPWLVLWEPSICSVKLPRLFARTSALLQSRCGFCFWQYLMHLLAFQGYNHS